MKAAVYYSNKDVRVEEVPEPKALGPGELLLKVDACGICGSDVMEWYRKPKAPLILGHETIGTVLKAGQGAGFREGERVFASHHVPCLECHACKRGHEAVCDTLRRTNLDPGGFAERCRVPAINLQKGGVLRIPQGMSDEQAVFIEPLGCAVRGQRNVGVRAGDSVLVLGCGTAGLLHVALAKASGAGSVLATDMQPLRLDAAKRLGADATARADEEVHSALRKATGGRLADVVICSTGAPPALQQAVRLVEPGGSVLWFAPSGPEQQLTAPFNELWRNEITLTSSYAAAPRDLKESLSLLGSGKLSLADLVTHQLPLAEARRAFALVADAREGLKVILRPNR